MKIGINVLPTKLFSPQNNSFFFYDSSVTFSWGVQKNSISHILVFAKDTFLRDTIKTFRTVNSNINIPLSSVGLNYDLYWGVFSIDASGAITSKPIFNRIKYLGVSNDGIDIVSPEMEEKIEHDMQPTIILKWLNRESAVSYEIQVDYEPTFLQASKPNVYNNHSLIKKLFVSAPDTFVGINKLKLDWNRDLYIRVRAIFSPGVYSKWSEGLILKMANPREEFLGDYIFDMDDNQYSGYLDTNYYYYDVPTSILITSESASIYISNTIIQKPYKPYYIWGGDEETYGPNKFFGMGDIRNLGTGSLQFSKSLNGDTTFVRGVKTSWSLGGGQNIYFSGYKLN